MDTGLCFLSGFIGGLVAVEAIAIISLVYCTPKRHRVPERAPESSTQPARAGTSNWKGVHLDIWA